MDRAPRVLLVSDDQEWLAERRSAFADGGYNTAIERWNAVPAKVDFEEMPDIVLIDFANLTAPIANGICHLIRAQGDESRIIAMVARSADATQIEAGAVDAVCSLRMADSLLEIAKGQLAETPG